MEKEEDKSGTRKLIVVVSALVLIPAAAIANGKAMWNLATFSHWDDITAVLLPLSLDGLAALSVYMWRKGRTPSARTFGRFTTVAAMGASVAVAAGGHMATAGMLEPTVVLVVSVGAIPALCLVAFIELLVLDADIQVGKRRKSKAAEKEEAPKPGTAAEVIPAPKPTPARTLTVVAGESVPGPEDRIREAVKALGEGASYAAIIDWSKQTYGSGLSKSKIREVRAAAN